MYLLYLIILIVLINTIAIINSNRSNYYSYYRAEKYIKRNNNIMIEDIVEEKFVPRKIIQTYKNIDLVPEKIIDNIKEKNPNWEYNFYNDNDCIKFLNENYGKDFVDKFNSFKKGAHKSDLFRLCWLYKNGGVYIDIDTEIISSLDDILVNIDNNFTFMQNTLRGGYYEYYLNKVFGYTQNTLINSFIITNKGNKNIKKCIENVMKINQEDLKNNYGLILFVMQKTFNGDMDYQIFEKESRPNNIFGGKHAIYDRNNKLIGYSKYDNYSDGKFLS